MALLDFLKRVKTPTFLKPIAGEYLFKREEEPVMTFRVGEGLTPAQKVLAEQKMYGDSQPSIKQPEGLFDILGKGTETLPEFLKRKIVEKKEIDIQRKRFEKVYPARASFLSRFSLSPSSFNKLVSQGSITKEEAELFAPIQIEPAITGMEKVTSQQAKKLLVQAVKSQLTRQDLLAISKGTLKDPLKLSAYKTMTGDPAMRKELSAIAKNEKISLTQKIGDYLKGIFKVKPTEIPKLPSKLIGKEISIIPFDIRLKEISQNKLTEIGVSKDVAKKISDELVRAKTSSEFEKSFIFNTLNQYDHNQFYKTFDSKKKFYSLMNNLVSKDVGGISKAETAIPKELQPLAQEARKFKSAEEFTRAFQSEIKHGEYWHITDNPSFTIDPKLGPRDLSSIASGKMEAGKLMVTSDIGYWNAEFPSRKFAAKLDFSNVKPEDYYQVNRGFGNEFFVKDPSKVRVEKVVPIEQALKEAEQYQKILEKNIRSKSQLTDFYNQAVKGQIQPSKPVPFLPKKVEAEKGFISKIQETISKVFDKQPPKIKTISLEPETTESIKKVVEALKKAKPIRGLQEQIYTTERGIKISKSKAVGEKVSGEKGFYSELGQLKGELSKVQFESIRKDLSQSDIDNLFDMVKNSPLLNDWEKISTRKALGKLFGEFGGKVPTEGELVFLRRVFPKELVKTLIDMRPIMQKIAEAGWQLANMPRSLMSSFLDLSFGLRQGVFAIPSYRKEFFDSFKKQFSWFRSEKSFQSVMEEIVRRPTFEMMRESKLSLTEMDGVMGLREERYMSQWAEKIPVVGKIVRATGRAYTAFANKFRADIFDSLVKDAEILGLRPKSNLDLTTKIAEFVNNATGRGKLPTGLERIAPALNAFFYSPRLMASRINLLRPDYYVKQPSFVRKKALKSLFAFAGSIMTILTLSKLAGAEVETDPRNSDFAKIRIGNTRIDILGGFQQYIRMAAQLLTGKYISSTTGKEYTLGEGYKPMTRFDIIIRQIESKEAPLFSFITDILRQQDYAGEKVKITKEIVQRITPMLAQDIYDLAEDDPSLLPLSALGIFGVGLQTYKGKEKESKQESLSPSEWLKSKETKQDSLSPSEWLKSRNK